MQQKRVEVIELNCDTWLERFWAIRRYRMKHPSATLLAMGWSYQLKYWALMESDCTHLKNRRDTRYFTSARERQEFILDQRKHSIKVLKKFDYRSTYTEKIWGVTFE